MKGEFHCYVGPDERSSNSTLILLAVLSFIISAIIYVQYNYNSHPLYKLIAGGIFLLTYFSSLLIYEIIKGIYHNYVRKQTYETAKKCHVKLYDKYFEIVEKQSKIPWEKVKDVRDQQISLLFPARQFDIFYTDNEVPYKIYLMKKPGIAIKQTIYDEVNEETYGQVAEYIKLRIKPRKENKAKKSKKK